MDENVLPAAPMSLRAYARRRGITATTVWRAVQSGRLNLSLVWKPRPGRKPLAQIADPDLADREFDANTDLTRAPAYVKEREGARPPAARAITITPPPGDGVAVTLEPQPHGGALKRSNVPDVEPGAQPGEAPMSLSDAAAHEKYWKARDAELKFKRAAGEVVAVADIEARLASMFTTCRTKLLGVPSKIKAALPHLTRQDIAVIDALQREALEDLSSTPIAVDDEAVAS